MEVFRLKSSQSIFFRCWTKICLNKCGRMACENNLPNSRIRLLKNESDFGFKKTQIHLKIDNPFGLHIDSQHVKEISQQLPQLIG